MSNYSQKKRSARGRFDGPGLYTHPRGAKVQVGTYCHKMVRLASMGLFDVELFQLPGEFDDEIKWPVKCTVTVHLLNQLGDHDHIRQRMILSLTRPQEKTYAGYLLRVHYRTIEDRSKDRIRYLKDDCLKFRVHVELN